MTTLTGCGTAIVTPFTRAGLVDEPALRKLVDWQITEGIDFLVPCGSTGEAQTLSAEERQRVVAIVIEVAAGRVPVVAGATSNDTARAVEETRIMCGLGADGILSATPYYNKPTQGGMEQHFRAVLDASTKPVIMYNVPGRTAVNLAPQTVLRLARHPNAYGIKEASGDVLQAMQIIRERPAGFMVLSGEDALTLPLVASGADGLISVASNEIPQAMTTLTRLCRQGELDDARALHYRLLPLLNANFIETNPAPVKAALAMMGRIENVLRLPLIPISDTTTRALVVALREAGCEGVEAAA